MGRFTASDADRLYSNISTSVWKTDVGIVVPPGVPITNTGLLFLDTIVGDIELSIRLPGAMAFASPPIAPYKFGAPGRVDVENNFPDSTIVALKKMGYNIFNRQSIGRTEVIKVLDNGNFEAVADSRGDDSAEGY